jgi:hypothetical protein
MLLEYFSFYNEFDMLDLKLQEHAPHVDRFVITESNRTYNQIDKPYRLEQQWQRYAPWHDRITYLKFDATGLEPGWPTEEAQREHGIRNVVPDREDTVLITDLDEFLTAKDFDALDKSIDLKREVLFNMTCYWCFADVVHNRGQMAIAACRYDNYVNSTTHRRPQKAFQHRDDPLEDTCVIEGGIHLTWMGDRAQFEEKLLGSIEGYNWSKHKSSDEMWESKTKNRLFYWKAKFKKGETRYLPLSDNTQFSDAMKDYISKKPNWLLDPKESS